MIKKMLKNASATILIVLSISAAPVTAEAQFFKKLAKGLEKVNKGLEKVENALDPNSWNKSQSDSSKPADSSEQSTATESAKGHEPVPIGNNHPFVTAETKYMQLARVYDDTVSDVHQGVFAINQNGLFSFWTVDGQCLFAAEWKLNNQSGSNYGRAPRFDSGVAVAVHKDPNADGKSVHSLLYLDGSVKSLDANWTAVTQFVDGLALVTQSINYNKSYFFINPRGEKAFPHLNITGRDDDAMRRLCDGLRAVHFITDDDPYGKWGFIDVAGNVVIPGRYTRAGDFRGGYCWVTEEGSNDMILIDKTGKETYRTDKTSVSSVGDGIFYAVVAGQTVYYDISGRELARFEDGNTFLGGHAFVSSSHTVSMVDTQFNNLKTYPNDVLNAVVTSQHGPVFGEIDLATYRIMTGNFVIDSDGEVVLEDWSGEYDRYMLSGFGMFRKSGYAKLTDIRIDNEPYKGLMRTDGTVEWLFGTTPTPDISHLPITPGPEPLKPIEPIPGPPIPGPIPVDPETPPIGPKEWSNPQYSVSVTQEGEGSVALSPAATVGYGELVTVTASAAEGWALAGIESEPNVATIASGQPFAVTCNMNIKVKFIKKEVVEPVRKSGAYQGVQKVELIKDDLYEDIAVYAEMSSDSAISSPYGDRTQGFIVVMFDASKRYVGKDASTYIFAAPLRIVGYQKDGNTGREWLVADGGSVTYGKLEVTPSNPLMALYMNTAMAFDGHSSPEVIPRRYRIEMLDYNADTDEFTLGELQTYSVKTGGWADAQSDAVTETTRGMFVSKTDHGLPADLFMGVKMKPAPKRNDVQWYPPVVWYDNDESTLRSIVEQMGNTYRSYRSDCEEMFAK